MSTELVVERLLNAEATETAAALDDVAADLVVGLEDSIGRALAGDRLAVAAYLVGWRRLEARITDLVRETHPDVVVDLDGMRLLVEVDGRRRPSEWAEVLALQAPFSPWAETFGRGRGAALAFVVELRARLPFGSPLAAPAPAVGDVADEASVESVHRFLRLAVAELSSEREPLRRIAEVFALSVTDLARLFGVRRQAVGQWLASGVPPGRAAKVNAIARVADILERNLKPDRLPGVVRRPADAYGGLSMLEMIERDRHDELVALVEDAFDWANAA
jgi:DNA-binding transcriptional regulator YdaS (Cro superfamily)